MRSYGETNFYDAPEFFAGETESYRRTSRLMVADSGEGPSVYFCYEISGPDYDEPTAYPHIWLTVAQARELQQSLESELS